MSEQRTKELEGPGNRWSSVPCLHCGHRLTKTISTGMRRGFYVRERRCGKCQRMFYMYEVSGSQITLLKQIKKVFTEHQHTLGAPDHDSD